MTDKNFPPKNKKVDSYILKFENKVVNKKDLLEYI